MESAPVRFYPSGIEPPAYPTSALAVADAEELPGCRLSHAVRRDVKKRARQAAEDLNLDALMFFAAAVEAEARRKSAHREPSRKTPA